MSISLAPLLLQAAIPPVTHRIASTVAVQVGGVRFENKLSTLVKQTLVRRSAEDYLLALEVLDTTQQATDLFSQVTADLNQLSERLLLRTDAQGCLVQVLNAPDLLQRWSKLRPQLEHKYALQPQVQPFLTSFGEQLLVPGTFEQSLRHKGIYGALLPGIYGQPLSSTQGTSSQRHLPNFFNKLSLPLQLCTVAGPVSGSASAAGLQLTTTGCLDETQFDRRAFERLIRTIVDDLTFPVALAVRLTEVYVPDLTTGWLASGTHSLVVEVPGAYYHETSHVITPAQEV